MLYKYECLTYLDVYQAALMRRCTPKHACLQIVVYNILYIYTQPSPSRSEASARKNVDVVRDWDLGVTSPKKVLQKA